MMPTPALIIVGEETPASGSEGAVVEVALAVAVAVWVGVGVAEPVGLVVGLALGDGEAVAARTVKERAVHA